MITATPTPLEPAKNEPLKFRKTLYGYVKTTLGESAICIVCGGRKGLALISVRGRCGSCEPQEGDVP